MIARMPVIEFVDFSDHFQIVQEAMVSGTNSFLLGNAALVVWGEVDGSKIDDEALNDWWTNEHLPERLDVPGFLRARRYASSDPSTNSSKYFTFYEVSSLDVLTSQPYMDKLNNPTPGTKEHISTLVTMSRSACELIHADVRQDLKTLASGIGATVAMFVLSLPARDEIAHALRDLLSKAFTNMQQDDRTAMSLNLLRENRAATEPGSSSQSYINVNLTPSKESDTVKWIILFEFSAALRQPMGGVDKVLKPVVDELSKAYGQKGVIDIDTYSFICGVSA
jgi:hypothetical protein